MWADESSTSTQRLHDYTQPSRAHADVYAGGASACAQVRLCAPFTHPAEVEFVAKPGAVDPEEGYLVYLEYDAARHRSTVVVLDAMEIEGAALCRLPLPHHVPYTFHGCVFQRA